MDDVMWPKFGSKNQCPFSAVSVFSSVQIKSGNALFLFSGFLISSFNSFYQRNQRDLSGVVLALSTICKIEITVAKLPPYYTIQMLLLAIFRVCVTDLPSF